MSRTPTSTVRDRQKGAGFVWLLTLAVAVVIGVLAYLYVRPPEDMQVNLRLPETPALPTPTPLPNPTPLPSPLPTPG